MAPTSDATMTGPSSDAPSSFSQSDIIDVFVGPKRQRFHLHKDLICARSPFFARCLRADAFKQGQENKIYLREDDPACFERLVDWMYTSRGAQLDSEGKSGLVAARTYILADKLCAEELKNRIVDTFRLHYCAVGGRFYENLKTLHRRGPPGCKLLSLLLAIYTFVISNNQQLLEGLAGGTLASRMEDLVDGGDGRLVVEILKENARYQLENYDDPRKRKGCHYHDHSNGEACYLTVPPGEKVEKKCGHTSYVP